MSKNIVKWGILGTSFISEVMADAINHSRTSQLTAIGSRSLEKGEYFSQKFSVPFIYNDYQSLIEDKNIDAVYIGLPNHLHKEWIIRAANAGKHILCEKPFVLNQNEMHEVIASVEKNKVICMEALMYRYHPFTHKLSEIITSKILGDIKLLTATYTANIAHLANPTASGAIRNLGCYPVSLIRLLANAEPIEMTAMGRLKPDKQNDSQASALLKFPNEVMAVVSTADDVEMHWHFEAHGTAGSLKVISNPWLPDSTNQCVIYKNNEKPIEIIVSAEKPLYTYQIDTVNQCIFQNSDAKPISLQDSLGNVVVLENWINQIR